MPRPVAIALLIFALIGSARATDRSQLIANLTTGSPNERTTALDAVLRDETIVLDDGLADALTKCAAEASPIVQAQLCKTALNRFIWSAKEQDPRMIAIAIKLAGNRDHEVRYNAIYYGLSTVREQSDDTIKAMLAAAAMEDDYDGNLHGRIAWALKRVPADKIEPLCEPYWGNDAIASKPKVAWVVYKIWKEATGKEPPNGDRFVALKAKIDELVAQRKAEHLKLQPVLAKQLTEGDSRARQETMRTIYSTPYLLSDLDDSMLDAFAVAANDPDWRVRWEVARVTGNRWVWSAEKQNAKAIDLALKLRKDPEQRVRHFALYFGLSTVRNPSDEVIAAMLDSAIVEHDSNDVSRVAWSLKSATPARLAALFEPYWKDPNSEQARRAVELYRAITAEDPPHPERFSTTNPSEKDYAAAFNDLYEHLGAAYPCFEMKQIDWKKVGDELLPKVADIRSDADFGRLCLRLVARLRDTHAQLIEGTAKIPRVAEFPQYDPGFACILDDRGKPVVYHVDDNGSAKDRIAIGTTILSVNGKPAAEVIDQFKRLLSTWNGYSSDRYLTYDAVHMFCAQPNQGDEVTLEVETPSGEKQSLKLPASVGGRYLPRLPVPIAGVDDSGAVEPKKLDDQTGYIYVRRIRGELPEQLDAALKQLGHVKGLIIDVRGNSGGGFDADRACRNFDPDDNTEPTRPRFTGPIALLLDERTVSAAEGWASWFVAKNRARTFGSATAGASSRKEEYTLTNGLYKVIVPVKPYTGFLDRPIEGRGLEPDVPVRCNAKDLAAGKDTVLETARKWLLERAK